MARCTHATRGGTPCKMPALRGEEFCWAHSSENGREKTAARRRGGRTSRAGQVVTNVGGVRLRTVHDIQAMLERTVGDLLRLPNRVPRGRAIGSLLNVAFTALERGEWEGRLAALEEQMREGRRVRRLG